MKKLLIIICTLLLSNSVCASESLPLEHITRPASFLGSLYLTREALHLLEQRPPTHNWHAFTSGVAALGVGLGLQFITKGESPATDSLIALALGNLYYRYRPAIRLVQVNANFNAFLQQPYSLLLENLKNKNDQEIKEFLFASIPYSVRHPAIYNSQINHLQTTIPIYTTQGQKIFMEFDRISHYPDYKDDEQVQQRKRDLNRKITLASALLIKLPHLTQNLAHNFTGN